MNGFLLNMIHRHQGQVDKVQPRTRSIFESEAGPEPVAAKENTFVNTADAMITKNRDWSPDLSEASSPVRDMQQTLPQTPTLKPDSLVFEPPFQATKNDPAVNSKPIDPENSDLLTAQIHSLLARLAEKSEPQLPIDNSQQIPESSQSSQTSVSHKTNEQDFSHRFEETLRRLTSQIDSSKEDLSGFDDPRQLLPAHINMMQADPLSMPTGQNQNDAKQSDQSLSKPNKASEEDNQIVMTGQTGMLQTPVWLNELQTNLKTRWQETNTQALADPVVNVTIGRIEIRATNANLHTQSPSQAKPKGVLSLEDYLKQRDSKGRA